jgi:hypothetical protein
MPDIEKIRKAAVNITAMQHIPDAEAVAWSMASDAASLCDEVERLRSSIGRLEANARSLEAGLRKEVAEGICFRQSPESKLARADVMRAHADRLADVLAGKEEPDA